MDYQQTIDFLFSRLPVFQNIGARAFKPGLYTTIELCNSLGNPQNKYPCIHVAGTNGKGSTSHMLASILQTAGYKVGLYTSPHLKSFTERIKVNGEEIKEDFVVKFTSENLSNIDKLNPSFFELTVSMAFSYFEKSQVDVAVIEVGMGGRLDSTNIITPILSVITNISYDHAQFLGDTLAKIAYEKAGIIKENVPVVVSEYQEDISSVFEETANFHHARIVFGSEQFEVKTFGLVNGELSLSVLDKNTKQIAFDDLRLDLTGLYQLKNVCGVLAATQILNKIGFIINNETIYLALEQVVSLTGLKGRWQKLGSNPLVYCDTAHNFAGLSDTIKQFNSISAGRKKFVIGFVGDKDISAILKLFPQDADFYFTQPSNARALPATELMDLAIQCHLLGETYPNVNDALKEAILQASPEDSIYVGGSTFVVADLQQL